jgi:hypothetical protein
MDSSRNWDRLAGGVSCSAASNSLLATFLAGYLGGSFAKGCSWRAGTDMVRAGIEEVRPFVKSQLSLKNVTLPPCFPFKFLPVVKFLPV